MAREGLNPFGPSVGPLLPPREQETKRERESRALAALRERERPASQRERLSESDARQLKRRIGSGMKSVTRLIDTLA